MKEIYIDPNLDGIMRERYYQPGETTPKQMVERVALYVANAEKQYGHSDEEVMQLATQYRDIFVNRLAIPSSPFLMNAGTKVSMLSACFVMDGPCDSMDSIFDTLKLATKVWKSGGGTGFNFSHLRETGAKIDSSGGTSSGVLSFMDVYNAAGDAVKQGGRRRVANMGVLRYDHPDILKFLSYKNDHSKLNNFNISILVDDKFMHAVEVGLDYDLISPKDGKPTGVILNAREVFNRLAENNWRSAEPALLFVDAINRANPMLDYLGAIEATNPCGEIPLYGNEACNLASINLEEFIDWNGKVDWNLLEWVTRRVIRFLDASIDVNVFPDPAIEKMVKSMRRLGLGIMGLHGALIKAGYKYSSDDGRDFAETLMRHIWIYAWDESTKLAKEKGAFPLWNKSGYATAGFPVRNVAVTTIAPTGTISQILDASASGCEPIFAITYKRRMIVNGETQEVVWVNSLFKDYAIEKGFWSDDLPERIFNNRGSVRGIIPDEYAELWETAMEISPTDHVKMQVTLQKWVDNSISKTINLPPEATVQDIADAYMLGWKLGLKGMTVYRSGSREGEILSVGEKKNEAPQKAHCAECEILPTAEELAEIEAEEAAKRL